MGSWTVVSVMRCPIFSFPAPEAFLVFSDVRSINVLPFSTLSAQSLDTASNPALLHMFPASLYLADKKRANSALACLSDGLLRIAVFCSLTIFKSSLNPGEGTPLLLWERS